MMKAIPEMVLYALNLVSTFLINLSSREALILQLTQSLYTKAKIPQSNCPKKIKPTKTQY